MFHNLKSWNLKNWKGRLLFGAWSLFCLGCGVLAMLLLTRLMANICLEWLVMAVLYAAPLAMVASLTSLFVVGLLSAKLGPDYNAMEQRKRAKREQVRDIAGIGMLTVVLVSVIPLFWSFPALSITAATCAIWFWLPTVVGNVLRVRT